MSRKDYVSIAEAILRTKAENREVLGSASILRVTANRIADVFAADNPRFDKARFMAACGFPGEDE